MLPGSVAIIPQDGGADEGINDGRAAGVQLLCSQQRLVSIIESAQPPIQPGLDRQ